MHNLLWLNSWLSALRPILETLFFAATVALAVIAIKGLEQLRIAKDTAKTAAKREAYKLAAEECRTFALDILPLSTTCQKECEALNLSCFREYKVTVVGGEITGHNFAMAELAEQLSKCPAVVMNLLNRLEAFSIFFVSGVAEETIAFRETSVAFCRLVRRYIPVIYLLRRVKGARFESIVQLYELWDARARSEDLLRTQETIGSTLKELTKKPITPIGLD